MRGSIPTISRCESGFDLHYAEKQPKAWKDIWSAGHGVGNIRAMESVAEIVRRLKGEYQRRSLASSRIRGSPNMPLLKWIPRAGRPEFHGLPAITTGEAGAAASHHHK